MSDIAQATTKTSIPAGTYWMVMAHPIDTAMMTFSNASTGSMFDPTLSFDFSNVQGYFAQPSASASFQVVAYLSSGATQSIWSGSSVDWQHVSVPLPADSGLRLAFDFYSQPDTDDMITPPFLSNVLVTNLAQTNGSTAGSLAPKRIRPSG